MLKKFFFWLAWLEHKDNTRSTIVVYSFALVLFIVFFPLLWLISRNTLKATTIAIILSVSIIILLVFISNCFFSSPRKNWMIAIYEAEKVIKDYSEFIADDYYSYYESKLREMLIPFTRKIKDPADLNEFVTIHKKLFEARKGLAVLLEQQKAFCEQIAESKNRSRNPKGR